jgi:hypothetical protein
VARRTCIEGSGVLVEPCQSSLGRSALDDRDLADLTRVMSASLHLPRTAAPRVLPDRLNERPGYAGTVRVVLALPTWEDYLRTALDDLLSDT